MVNHTDAVENDLCLAVRRRLAMEPYTTANVETANIDGQNG